MSRSALLMAVCLIAAGLAGCIGDGADEDPPGPVDDGDPADQPADPSGEDTVRTLAASDASSSVLGLAVYDGIPPENVKPFVPANLTPVECFRPRNEGVLDVVLIAERRTHTDLPYGGEPVDLLALAGCAKRPEGLALEGANEAPWVELMSWVDGDGYERFLAEQGFPATNANTTIEEVPRGYTVSASRDGTGIVDMRFVTSPVGDPVFFDCTPSQLRGRMIGQAPDGSLGAVDWNKTESVCPAEAEVNWPADSPIAEVLGPAHAPDFVADTRVEEARYWWRDLPGTGG